MEKDTQENSSSPLEIVLEFQEDQWLDTYGGAGIPTIYFKTWLHNYKISNPVQENIVSQIKQAINQTSSMVMLGKIGNGKTHLAISVLKNALVRRKSGLYYTLTGLFRAFRNSMSDPEQREVHFANNLFSTDCLIIDEINIRSDSEAENRFLQELIDKRHVNQKRTIFVGNLTLDEFEGIVGTRIMDRMKDEGADIFVFNWDSYRGTQ